MKSRLGVLALLSVVMGASWMLAPAKAYADAVWERGVAFPNKTYPLGPSIPVISGPVDVNNVAGVSIYSYPPLTPHQFTGLFATGVYSTANGGEFNQDNGNFRVGPDASVADPQNWAGATLTWTATARSKLAGSAAVLHLNYCSNTTGTCGTEINGPTLTFTSTSFTTQTVDFTIPVGARRWALRTQTNMAVALNGFNVTAGGTAIGGDCIGVQETLEGVTAGGAESLSWGASGLSSTTHTQWGDYFVKDRGCRFAKSGHFDYVPPEGFTTGDTYMVEFNVSSVPGQTCQFTVAFDTGLVIAQLVIATIRTQEQDPTRGVGFGIVDVPGGTVDINIESNNQCYLRRLAIANIEGDATWDDGQTHLPPGFHTGGEDGDPFASCSPPSEFIDVPGWLSYGACLVSSGFNAMIQWFGTVAGYLGSLVTAGLSAALDLTGAVWDGLMAALQTTMTTLLVPVHLGDDWQAFMDDVGTRVPFGWFGQVNDVISSSLSAGSSSLPDAELMGVSVTAPIGDALGAIEPYRGLIFAGVALMMVTGCLRWIMAAVGVSPSGGGEE